MVSLQLTSGVGKDLRQAPPPEWGPCLLAMDDAYDPRHWKERAEASSRFLLLTPLLLVFDPPLTRRMFLVRAEVRLDLECGARHQTGPRTTLHLLGGLRGARDDDEARWIEVGEGLSALCVPPLCGAVGHRRNKRNRAPV